MKRLFPMMLPLAAALILVACSEQSSDPVSPESHDGTTVMQKKPIAFMTQLTSTNTNARGQAIFNVHPSGTSIDYRLIATNIDNVIMAHIHLAPLGVNGPVVVWLYPSSPPAASPSGPLHGIFASGTITASDLTGPLASDPLSDLIDAMAAGNTYVNVHTTDYPAGEIRGQIR